MSFLFSNPLDELVEKATSENHPIGEDLTALYFEVADKIKSKEVTAKSAIASIKKRLTHKNPNVQILTLHLIDICIKNSGQHFLLEVSSKEFVDALVNVIKAAFGTAGELRQKGLFYLQAWGIAFKSNPQLCYMTTVYEAFKNEGTVFPPIDKVASNMMMINTTTAPEWVDSDRCSRCRTPFTPFNRKHHCRNCGDVFCNNCSSHRLALPHLGIAEKQVRVCDGCFSKLTSGTKNVDDFQKTRSKEEEDEDEEFERAIQASLEEAAKKEAKDSKKSKKDKKKRNVSFQNEDEDEDLKRAIEASLVENHASNVSKDSVPYPLSEAIPQETLYKEVEVPKLKSAPQEQELSKAEIETLKLFSDLVEKTLADVNIRGPQALNLSQLQASFYQVQNVSAKLSINLVKLEEKQRYLMSLNEKITEAIVSYEKVLQDQLAAAAYPTSQQGYYPSGYGTPAPYGGSNQAYPVSGYSTPPIAAQPPYHYYGQQQGNYAGVGAQDFQAYPTHYQAAPHHASQSAPVATSDAYSAAPYNPMSYEYPANHQQIPPQNLHPNEPGFAQGYGQPGNYYGQPTGGTTTQIPPQAVQNPPPQEPVKEENLIDFS